MRKKWIAALLSVAMVLSLLTSSAATSTGDGLALTENVGGNAYPGIITFDRIAGTNAAAEVKS